MGKGEGEGEVGTVDRCEESPHPQSLQVVSYETNTTFLF